jgi:dolichol-phosphate mannosyltransferase
VRVGFLDGSLLYRVRSYETARQMWREWGRSLDLKDASTPVRQWMDVAHLWLAQGLPIPALATLFAAGWVAAPPSLAANALVGVNAALLGVRQLLLLALRGAYERARWPFWLSALADPLAALRITLSSMRRPTRWRTREYARA